MGYPNLEISTKALRTGAIVAALLASILSSGCNNNRLKASALKGSSSATGGRTAPVSTSGDTFKISNVTIAVQSSSGGTAGAPLTTVYFDAAQSTVPISNHCNSAISGETATKPCLCQFSWQEVNTQGSAPVTIPRLVTTDVAIVQPNLVSCNAPDVYATEIPDGTLIKISVVPGPSSAESFSVTAYNFTKSKGTGESGNFKDAQGRSFVNVARYSCYEERKRGMSIVNKIDLQTRSTTGEVVKTPAANRFCLLKFSNNGQLPEGCENLAPSDYTAQSYYYNLFIRESEIGDINPGNGRYACPTVQESLHGTGTVGGQGQYWPLDMSFSLSMGKTPEFNVGVEANTKASNTADPTSASTRCDGTTTSTGGKDTLVQSCLGFAARPNSDGSCPYFTDSSGNIRFTYRLRRYFALYPPVFDTDGAVRNESQASDTIYVLDRPVNAAINPDPLKPFTMRGPKPCPYSFFDHKKVLDSTTPNYAATNDPRWTGKNVDSIEFPRADTADGKSCSAVLPILTEDKTVMTVTTVNAINTVTEFQRVFVRPIKAFTPSYVEDTEFQACAPLADPLIDPPLHFAKSADGNVSWCAESYPTQNNNVGKIDTHTNPNDLSTPFTGNVRPYTSHVAKNSSSAACVFSSVTIPSNYPAGGKARHTGATTVDRDKSNNAIADNKTCDRTVVNPPNGVTWPKFPLLAPPNGTVGGAGTAGVEEAIAGDASYNCTVTYDNGGTKTGKASPTQGCCGSNVQVWTGAAPSAPNNASNAHLEPDASCLVPNY